MPVSIGGEILASQYNALRTSVNTILNTNYGQSLISTQASASVTAVTSLKKRELFLDIQRTQVHHTAALNADISIPPVGVTIAAATSQNYNQSTGALTAVTNGVEMGYNDFESAVNTLSNFNPSTLNIWPVENFTLGTATNSTRSTTWGGNAQVQSIYHVLTFTFASQAARSQYFSAGGELRFTAALSNVVNAKGTDWQNLLSAIGTVRFNKWRLTASSGTPNPGGSGFDSLSSIYRLLYTKAGSGVYADNDYTIEAQLPSSTVIRFRIAFNDSDIGTSPIEFPNTGIDEPVQGTVTSTANTFRPNSSFVFNSESFTAVSLPAPTIATAVELTANNASPPA
jgi:hypothetical protein